MGSLYQIFPFHSLIFFSFSFFTLPVEKEWVWAYHHLLATCVISIKFTSLSLRLFICKVE